MATKLLKEFANGTTFNFNGKDIFLVENLGDYAVLGTPTIMTTSTEFSTLISNDIWESYLSNKIVSKPSDKANSQAFKQERVYVSSGCSSDIRCKSHDWGGCSKVIYSEKTYYTSTTSSLGYENTNNLLYSSLNGTLGNTFNGVLRSVSYGTNSTTISCLRCNDDCSEESYSKSYASSFNGLITTYFKDLPTQSGAIGSFSVPIGAVNYFDVSDVYADEDTLEIIVSERPTISNIRVNAQSGKNSSVIWDATIETKEPFYNTIASYEVWVKGDNEVDYTLNSQTTIKESQIYINPNWNTLSVKIRGKNNVNVFGDFTELTNIPITFFNYSQVRVKTENGLEVGDMYIKTENGLQKGTIYMKIGNTTLITRKEGE